MMWPFNLIWPNKPEPTPAEVILEVQDAKDEVGQDLRQVFLEAAKQAAEERAALEKELLNNGKLQQYLRSTIKYIASELLKQDSYDFMLVGYSNCGVAASVFDDYAAIFLKIAKEFGIEATISGNYIKVDKASVKKALSELMPPTPPLDMEKLRGVLRTGPYR